MTNHSINQTLSRTVITSGLVFLSVIAMVLFGGEMLRGFSLCLAVGYRFRHLLFDRYCQSDHGLVAKAAGSGESGLCCSRRKLSQPGRRARSSACGRSAKPVTRVAD